jgi:hypothetical protein
MVERRRLRRMLGIREEDMWDLIDGMVALSTRTTNGLGDERIGVVGMQGRREMVGVLALKTWMSTPWLDGCCRRRRKKLFRERRPRRNTKKRAKPNGWRERVAKKVVKKIPRRVEGDGYDASKVELGISTSHVHRHPT